MRERSGTIFKLAQSNELQHFEYRPEQLQSVATFVAEIASTNYPELVIPPHSRWRHLEKAAAGELTELERRLAGTSPEEQARVKIEIAITSVLLDAGAGARWKYYHGAVGDYLGRSEGLALASLDWFMGGGFSHQKDVPLQVTSKGLESLQEHSLREAFQVNTDNPLDGCEGRISLLRNLGHVLAGDPRRFGAECRLGNFYDHLKTLSLSFGGTLEAAKLVNEVLRTFSAIWPGRIVVDSVNLGDVWEYRSSHASEFEQRLVPFHKLSQWLSYSLLEPLTSAGVKIINLDELTALAEYRNGGLFIDFGVLVPRSSFVLSTVQTVESDTVIEWRAMTVCLVDLIAGEVRSLLGKTKEELPLPSILQGGTWEAGRLIAKRKRKDGSPPLRIKSDGTVF